MRHFWAFCVDFKPPIRRVQLLAASRVVTVCFGTKPTIAFFVIAFVYIVLSDDDDNDNIVISYYNYYNVTFKA